MLDILTEKIVDMCGRVQPDNLTVEPDGSYSLAIASFVEEETVEDIVRDEHGR